MLPEKSERKPGKNVLPGFLSDFSWGFRMMLSFNQPRTASRCQFAETDEAIH